MTKRDYVAIAQWLRVHDIPRILEKDNPAFDEDRFMRYINTTIEMEGLTDE